MAADEEFNFGIKFIHMMTVILSKLGKENPLSSNAHCYWHTNLHRCLKAT